MGHVGNVSCLAFTRMGLLTLMDVLINVLTLGKFCKFCSYPSLSLGSLGAMQMLL